MRKKELGYIFIEHDLWTMLIHQGDQKVVMLRDMRGRRILISGSGLHIAVAMNYILSHRDDFGVICEDCHECGKCMDCIVGTGWLSNRYRMQGGGANEMHKLTDEDLSQFQDMLYQAVVIEV